MNTDAEAAADRHSEPSPEGVRVMKASEFRAKCLKLMDEVAAGAGEIVITKNGRPVSRLVPVRKRPSAPFGRSRGRFRIVGDIVSPLDIDWDEIMNLDRVLDPES